MLLKLPFAVLAVIACVTLTPGANAETASGNNTAAEFQIRGLKGLFWDGIEKYYKAVPWMADHDMNFLMLCYTAFPESARDWRKDYSDQHLAEMKELVTRANDKGVSICLSFNPGIWSKPPLCHSCEEDYQASWQKVKDAHDLGIYWIALCLDDIHKGIVPQDTEKYGTLQDAQVAYVNRLWADMKTLSPQPKLIFCPSAYTTGEMKKFPDYTKVIGEKIDPEIDLFWTGPEVCSPAISVANAQEAERLLGRKPFIWDNYPVNDMFPWRPLLAPVKGRDPNLAGAISGILFNPMKQWEINKIPLVSVADYLADPAGYDPTKSAEKAVNEFPEPARPAVRLLQKYYGSAFIGEPGYPPGLSSKTAEETQTLFSDLALLKKLMTNPDTGLLQMWEEVKDTVEGDLAQASLLAEGPVTYGYSFVGGAPGLARKAFGQATALVYAQSAGRSSASTTITLREAASAPGKIRFMARNSDIKKPQIRITINSELLHEGELAVPQDKFAAVEIPVPAGAIKVGQNSLQIVNLETEGQRGMPPWFAVQWIQLLP